jgi:hypothetical protein
MTDGLFVISEEVLSSLKLKGYYLKPIKLIYLNYANMCSILRYRIAFFVGPI